MTVTLSQVLALLPESIMYMPFQTWGGPNKATVVALSRKQRAKYGVSAFVQSTEVCLQMNSEKLPHWNDK